MKRNKKKQSRFMRYSKRLLIFSVAIFAIGIVALNSYESTLNVESQELEDEIATIQAEIDGLDMEKLELASFSRIQAIAEAKGYTYKQSTMTAAVVGVQSD